MNRKLLKIANELNELILHLDIEAWCRFTKYEGGSVSVELTHFDDRYRHENKSLMIFSNRSDEEVQKAYEQMKRVITGEALIDE
ncbi:TPA: hypothetical protein O9445_002094 [Staphylococcus aureus]|nr:hypothetical protein [Staphylococcus aureus]HDD0314269.1 hypothetical protein [Staphylococcus aureus]HDD0443514.1 hypothetical protein [Staphylococcus aureus]HDD0456165.1 hypothetical protein [Staphylococcus aureus]HDD0494921.1 hypothetical protein [Staphylococcus aureus]